MIRESDDPLLDSFFPPIYHNVRKNYTKNKNNKSLLKCRKTDPRG